MPLIHICIYIYAHRVRLELMRCDTTPLHVHTPHMVRIIPPGCKFQKSEGPPGNTGDPFSSSFLAQIVCEWRNLDIDHDDFRRWFQLCPPHVLNPVTDLNTRSHFWQNLGHADNLDFLKPRFFDAREIQSLVTRDTSRSLHTCPDSFLRSLFFDDFCCRDPLSPSFIWPNHIQKKNSRHQLWWFSM